MPQQGVACAPCEQTPAAKRCIPEAQAAMSMKVNQSHVLKEGARSGRTVGSIPAKPSPAPSHSKPCSSQTTRKGDHPFPQFQKLRKLCPWRLQGQIIWWLPCGTQRERTRLYPPPPCISYANVHIYYGPYAYCGLDKGVACAQHIQLLTHTCAGHMC